MFITHKEKILTDVQQTSQQKACESGCWEMAHSKLGV